MTTLAMGQNLMAVKLVDLSRQDSYRSSIQTNSTAASCNEANDCPQFTRAMFDDNTKEEAYRCRCKEGPVACLVLEENAM